LLPKGEKWLGWGVEETKTLSKTSIYLCISSCIYLSIYVWTCKNLICVMWCVPSETFICKTYVMISVFELNYLCLWCDDAMRWCIVIFTLFGDILVICITLFYISHLAHLVWMFKCEKAFSKYVQRHFKPLQNWPCTY
jgi:hypothetical protein